jgi:hypothetical protein
MRAVARTSTPRWGRKRAFAGRPSWAGHVGRIDLGRVSPDLPVAGLQEIRPAGAPAKAGRAMR